MIKTKKGIFLLGFELKKKKTFFLCSGGISDNLQDKRKKFQNKRKNPITDSSELKKFPCKKFRKVSSERACSVILQ